MFDRVINYAYSVAVWVDEKLENPRYLSVLLGFWIAIGLCGAMLVFSTLLVFSTTVFVIGMLDIVLSIGFGIYYYSLIRETKGRHQKPENF